MELPGHKTKIVCTIGPSSSSHEVLLDMIRNGMNVARLNLSHGTFEEHREHILEVRAAAAEANLPVSILIDLPGPKIRLGVLRHEPLLLRKGDSVILTTDRAPGDASRIPVDFDLFPEMVAEGSTIYLNDGFLQLSVRRVAGSDVVCTVLVGGHLLSHKGLNLVGVTLPLDAVTERDLECITFGLREGVDSFSISFIQHADDIRKAREFAEELGKEIRIVAKIERKEALDNLDEILLEADGVMIARGDLGVQIPIEEVPSVQKRIIRKANILGRPVITATQMLESMTDNIRPTRAEVTDVANAILDGTDAVMLSEETSIGKYPVETIAMMASIARSIERQRASLDRPFSLSGYFRSVPGREGISVSNVVSLNVIEAMEALRISYIVTPTRTGTTPRQISRFKPDAWVLSFTRNENTHRFLAFSYGVFSFLIESESARRHGPILQSLKDKGLIRIGDQVILTEGVSPGHPGTDSLTILTVQ